MRSGIAINLRVVVVLLLGLCLSSLNAAPNYIDNTSLEKVLANVNTGPVSTSTPLSLPIITWGGDLATILANGGGDRTSSNSLFGNAGLDFKLVRQDVFSNQVQNYIEGKSPFLRGTMGMVNMAMDVIGDDPATAPVIIYQLTWSTGGDALVVKGGISSAADLRGKTIALQAYGPHVDYMTKILADAGLSVNDVTIKWLPDLSGTDNSPMAALQESDIDAAFVITPDALVLTSGGSVGTGAEDSVRGAKILFSTRTANKIISDVYAVRNDYYNAHKKEISDLVTALVSAQEQLTQRMSGSMSNKADRALLSSAAKLLLDSEQAVADVKGLYGDCEFVGASGNQNFFNNANYPRSMDNLSSEIQASFIELGLLSKTQSLTKSGIDFGTSITAKPTNRFDQEQVASVIARKQQQGTLGEGELFSFEIFFGPNQNDFSSELYEDSFNKVMDYAATYGGALITVEGHSDPLGYLRQKKNGATELVLGRIKQSAKNLSLTRTIAVRNSLIEYSKSKSIQLDDSQFAVIGHGIAQPKSGICGDDPCAPKTEKDWRDNMRVQFRIIQVEAESSVFSPL